MDLVPAPDLILDPDPPFDTTTEAGSSMDLAPDPDLPRAEGSWIRIQKKIGSITALVNTLGRAPSLTCVALA